MADGKKRKSEETVHGRKKFRSDGKTRGKRHVEGPGIWVTCVKGKEKQTVREICDLFESVASEIWPKKTDIQEDSDSEEAGISIEDQVAKEITSMKQPRRENSELRFVNCQTDTQCVLFISCKPPIDPMELVFKYVRGIEGTGVMRTRYVHRLVPVADTTIANIPEIERLCQRVFFPFFTRDPDAKYTYKIELRIRNHTTIPRQTIINAVARCLPDGHTVNLDDPQLFILVEVFKNTCGVSVVEDYYRWHKFNVMEIANTKGMSALDATSRIPQTRDQEI